MKERFYNGANRKDRSGYIIGEDSSIPEGVALEYAKLEYRPLNQFRNIGNASFDSVSTKTPEFQAVRERFEKLAKSDPKAAEQLVLLYNELGPEKYGDVLGSFADNVADPENKDFAEKMIKGLERNPDSLRQTFKAYAEAKDNRTLDDYINNVKGVSPARVPSAPARTPSSTPPVAPSVATASTPSPSTTGMSDQEIEDFLSDPKYKEIVDKLKASGQYDRLVASAKSNKKVLDQFGDPGTRKQLSALAEAGDMNGFFRKLEGVQLQTAMSSVKSDDIKGMLGSFGEMFSGFEKLGPLLERIFTGMSMGGDPVKMAEKASRDTGAQIQALLESKDPKKRAYGEELLNGAMGAVSTSNPTHARHEHSVLLGAGVNVDLLAQAQQKKIIGLDQIVVSIDPNTREKVITGKPVPYVSRSDIISQGTPIKVQIAGQPQNDPQFNPLAPTGTTGMS